MNIFPQPSSGSNVCSFPYTEISNCTETYADYYGGGFDILSYVSLLFSIIMIIKAVILMNRFERFYLTHHDVTKEDFGYYILMKISWVNVLSSIFWIDFMGYRGYAPSYFSLWLFTTMSLVVSNIMKSACFSWIKITAEVHSINLNETRIRLFLSTVEVFSCCFIQISFIYPLFVDTAAICLLFNLIFLIYMFNISMLTFILLLCAMCALNLTFLPPKTRKNLYGTLVVLSFCVLLIIFIIYEGIHYMNTIQKDSYYINDPSLIDTNDSIWLYIMIPSALCLSIQSYYILVTYSIKQRNLFRKVAVVKQQKNEDPGLYYGVSFVSYTDRSLVLSTITAGSLESNC